jgi:hypothetical protein
MRQSDGGCVSRTHCRVARSAIDPVEGRCYGRVAPAMPKTMKDS